MKIPITHKGAKAQRKVLGLPEPSPFTEAKAHAAEFYRLGRAAGQHAILCGLELMRLQETCGTTQGKRTDLTSSHGERKLSWEKTVESEVGISYPTAARWMQAARAQLPAIMGRLSGTPQIGGDEAEMVIEIESWELESVESAVAELTEGKTLEQLLLPLDAAGEFDPTRLTGKAKDAWEKIVILCEPFDDDHLAPKLFSREEYDAMHEDALVMRKRVEAGEIPPTRAWAGMRGRAAADGVGGRSATDHYRNLTTGLTKLRNSLEHWDELPTEDRAEIEIVWQELLATLPGSWKATLKNMEGWK